jgi:hypothetical protein
MKKLLPFFIFLSFLICYLEWAGGNSGFIAQLEYDLFRQGIHKNSFFHPLILLPLVGQILLLVFLFLPNRRFTIASILLLSVLVVMIFIVGVLAMNFKIILSTLPFIVLSILYIFWSKEKKE